MSKRLAIKTNGDSDQYIWTELPGTSANAGALVQSAGGSLADLKQYIGDGHYQLIFLAPAGDVLVKTVEFSAQERKHILKTVPYLLEENLISDIDSLHIVMAKPGSDSLTVAAVDEENMAHWLALFEEAGLTLNLCLPEQLVLLPQQNWSLFYWDQQYLFRNQQGMVYVIDSANIEMAMNIATEQFAELPGTINLIVSDEMEKESALKGLPDALQHLVAVEVKPLQVSISEQLSFASTWNFMQGKFARTAQWTAIWKQWQIAVIMLAVAFVVHTGVSYGELQQLDAKNLTLRQEIEKIHRTIFPKGQIVDPKRQMETELKRLKGGGSGGFVIILEKIGGAMNGATGLELNSISYDVKNGDVRLDLVVENFQEVEKIKAGVEKHGLMVELLNSNAQGQKVRARLRVKG